MLTHTGMHLGDSWYFVEGENVHAYYLVCPKEIERHTSWDIAHAVSDNLIDWYDHEIVVRRGDPGQWDDMCLATGSVIKHENRYWMAYTAKWDKPDVAIGLAVSDDLYTWEKCPWNPITKIDENHYEKLGSGERSFSHWRDPYLFKDGGYVYHAVCASKNSGPKDSRGTVGLAKSKDMRVWEVVAPPVVEEVVQELECPQIRKEGNHYMLLFSSFYDLFSEKMKNSLGPDVLRQSAYCMWSETLFGPYHFGHQEPIIPKNLPVQPYAVQAVHLKGKTYLMGTVWDFEQDNDFLTDPIEVGCDGQKYVLEHSKQIKENQTNT